MKKSTRIFIKFAAFLLSLVLVLPLQAQAALPETVEPQANQYISNTSCQLQAKGNGKLNNGFSIQTYSVMKKLGVQTIVLYESTDNVEYFPVRVYYSSDYSGMMGSNTYWHSYSLTYSGVARRYYRASFVFTVQTNSGVKSTITEWSMDVRAT